MSRTRPRSGRIALALVVLGLLFSTAAPLQANPPCEAAVEYKGVPLHPAPADSLFPAASIDLEGRLPEALEARLDKAVQWILANTKAPGITAAVGLPGKGLWSTSQGKLRSEPATPLPENAVFHWASVGKAFTAVIVMQLVAEGKLDYADPLARWYPRMPNAGAITIDHLLTHTSGLFSANADVKLRKDQGKYQSPERMFEVARKHDNLFCPGENWDYSNTGYFLLGRILEQIEGKPFHQIVQRRILEPLGLKQTIALAPKQVPENLALGHIDGKPFLDFEVTTPYSAGNIAGPARDLLLFWSAFLSGRLIPQQTVLEAYAHLYPMFDSGTFYGRGVMLYQFANGEKKGLWLGHSGGTPGFKSVIAYEPATGIFVAVALNGNVSAEASANKLLAEVHDFYTETVKPPVLRVP